MNNANGKYCVLYRIMCDALDCLDCKYSKQQVKTKFKKNNKEY